MVNDLTIAIIAGGKSRRLGQDKAMIQFRGRSLLEHAINIAQTLVPTALIIVGQESNYRSNEVTYIQDIIRNYGPIGGVYTALQKVTTRFIATLPCDIPLLPVKVYEILLQFKNDDHPVVARSHTGLEPLIALWPQTALGEIERAIQQQNFTLYRLLARLGAIEVNFTKTATDYQWEWFFNVNSLADLHKLEQL